MSAAPAHAAALERELAWAGSLIDAAMRLYFGQECAVRSVDEIEAPAIDGQAPGYPGMVRAHALSPWERLVLVLALAPHLRPQLLDPFRIRNDVFGGSFTEFGGVPGAHAGFYPTVETAAFVLAGASLERRLALYPLFEPERALLRHELIELEPGTGRGLFGSALHTGRHSLGRLTAGRGLAPEFSSAFPARRLSTALDWDDLVLDAAVVNELEEVRAWIEHGERLADDWQLRRHLKPGYRCLFHGPPGTGKTLAAALLGKACGLPVYRVDLAQVVSKYIGETEKNLGSVFDHAQRERWILFFDEADALFGKRTQASSANDRHANQEVAYLLQRVEDFPGVALLATNLKGNIDEAFARRFQSVVYFPAPRAPERLRLWRNACGDGARIESGVDLRVLADEFELTGAAIANVMRHAALGCVRRGNERIGMDDLRRGIRRELWKEGKTA